MRSEQEAERALSLYADTVRRLCMVYLKNYADTEDIFQTVFLKYLRTPTIFESEEHEKAWFIRVTINACKDHLKSFFRRQMVSLDALLPSDEPAIEDEHKELLSIVLGLPEKYRDVIYLFYYEGYQATEIAQMLGKNVNTVYTLLGRAREMLKKELEESHG